MLEYQYALQLQALLPGFTIKKTNPLLINFKCPHCGDSHKKKFKYRGYLIQESDGNIYNYCHNCREHMSFSKFLRFMSPVLYEQYRMEKFKVYKEENRSVTTTQKTNTTTTEFLKQFETIASLSDLHDAKIYVKNRKIPTKFWEQLYYCENFSKILQKLDPDRLGGVYPTDRRVIIPTINIKNELILVNARSIDGSDKKYIKYVFNKDALPIFGLDKIDFTKRIFVVEGEIDSMYLDNAIALGTQHYSQEFVDYIYPYRNNVVFIYDNEPRNKNTVKIMKTVIEDNMCIVIWPLEFSKFKDIGSIVESGIAPDQLQHILEQNITSGLSARAKLANWK